VFALQGNVREHLAMLEQVGVEARSVRRPSELEAVDALVLPGGESTTMDKLARAFELFEPLQKRIADGMPVFGTCAGMIMLANEITGGIEGQETLGGLDVTVRRNAFGRQVDSFEADLEFSAFDAPYHAVFIRAPWVERVGRDVEVPRSAAGHVVPSGDDRGRQAARVLRRPGARPLSQFGGRRVGFAMSGHSKWATTKHKKAVIDSRRAKLFAKLIKNIEVAARTGGGDLSGNPTLYDAVQKAKKSSVPNDNIDRAVKRGSGAEAGGADWQSITYEGYGPNGVAMLIECLTDNRNRAAADVRTAMTRNGGSLADPNSVAYLFNRKGVVVVNKEQDGKTYSEDEVMEAVLEAGADEVNDLGEAFEVISEATDLVKVRTALQDAGIDYESAEASFVPSMTVELDADGAGKIFRLIDALEDSDDVQNVYANFDVSDDVMEQVG
jgi:pyridoxal 5'-phosphate synthase glutaminase subunit Pdx2